MNEDYGVESIAAAAARPAPYRWPAHDVRAYGVGRTGSLRRLPRSGRSAGSFALESLLDELAARARARPARAAPANLVQPGDKRDRRQALAARSARGSASSGCETTSCGARRDELPAGRGRRLAVGCGPARLGAASAACRLDEDGKLTVETAARRHERHGHRVPDDRGSRIRASPRAGARGLRDDTAAHRDRRPRAAARRSRIPSAARSSWPRRMPASSCSTSQRAELETEPDDLELVGDAVQPAAHRAAAGVRGAGAQGLFSGSPHAGRGLRQRRRRRPARPVRRPRLARAR